MPAQRVHQRRLPARPHAPDRHAAVLGCRRQAVARVRERYVPHLVAVRLQHLRSTAAKQKAASMIQCLDADSRQSPACKSATCPTPSLCASSTCTSNTRQALCYMLMHGGRKAADGQTCCLPPLLCATGLNPHYLGSHCSRAVLICWSRALAAHNVILRGMDPAHVTGHALRGAVGGWRACPGSVGSWSTPAW